MPTPRRDRSMCVLCMPNALQGVWLESVERLQQELPRWGDVSQPLCPSRCDPYHHANAGTLPQSCGENDLWGKSLPRPLQSFKLVRMDAVLTILRRGCATPASFDCDQADPQGRCMPIFTGA